MNMKSLFAIAILALTFTTGFTCSKNTPEAVRKESPAAGVNAGSMENMQAQPSQEQMAQPPSEPSPTTAPEGSSTAPAADAESK